MLWLALLLTVILLVTMGLLLFGPQRSTPPMDDALALRLAADLGTSAPVLTDDGRWRIDLGASSFVVVGASSAQVDHESSRRASGRVGLWLEPPARGLQALDYAPSSNRTLVADADSGEWKLFGGGDLKTWERRIPEGFATRMRELGVEWVSIDGPRYSAGNLEHADVVRDVVALLSELAAGVGA